MIEWISNAFIGLGLAFLILGVYGLFRYKDFYTRILVASKVDTVGFLLIIIGMMLKHGFSFFTGKLLLMGIMMVTVTPFVATIVVRSSFADSAMKRPAGAEDEDVSLCLEKAQESVDGPWI